MLVDEKNKYLLIWKLEIKQGEVILVVDKKVGETATERTGLKMWLEFNYI